MPDKSKPKFNLLLEEYDNYLYASVSGPQDSEEVSIQFWKEILTKAEELNVKKILVEEDFPNQLSVLEIHAVAEVIANHFTNAFQIAHVDKHASDIDLNVFGETVARNRGLWVRVFQTLEDAEEWLAKQ